MVADLNNLVRLQRSQIKPAAEILARAYQDDPLFAYFIPSASERKNKSPYLFQLLIRHGVSYGEVHATSPNLEGVAVWLPPEKVNMTLWRMLQNGALSIYFQLGREFISRSLPANRFVSSLHKRHTPFRHWFLQLIGVEPGLQGKGYGGALLKAMFARIDKEHLPCYLDTQNKKNVPIYQHYGFKVVEEVIIPGAEISHWAMLREKPS